MVALLSMWRLVVGLVVVVLGGGVAHRGFAREPVVIEVADDARVDGVAFTPDSDKVLALRSGELSIWRTNPGADEDRAVKRIELAPDSAPAMAHVAPIAVSGNGKYVAVPIDGKGDFPLQSSAVQVWDITKYEAVGTIVADKDIHGHSYFVFAPNGVDLYIAIEQSIELWSPKTGERREIASAKSMEGQAMQHMRVLDDGSLVTARADGRLCLWDTEKPALKTFRQLRTSIYFFPSGGTVRKEYIISSPDAKRVVAADLAKPAVIAGGALVIDPSAGYTLTIWDMEKSKPLRKLPLGHGKRDVGSVDWSSDGQWIAWSSYETGGGAASCEFVVWDVARGRELLREKAPKGITTGRGIKFSPNGKMLAMPASRGLKESLVLLWDISDLTKEEPSRSESKQKDAAK